MSKVSALSTLDRKNTKFLGQVAAVLIVLVVLSFGGYRYIYLPQVVVGSLNQNITELNEFNRSSKDAIDQLTQIASSADFQNKDTAQVSSILDQARTKNDQLNALINSLDSRISRLNPGPNQDTVDFKNLVVRSMSQRNQVMKNFHQFMTYQICLVDIANQINSNHLSNVDKINQLSSSASNQQVGDAFGQASKDFTTNAQLIDKSKGCVTDQFKQYWQAEADNQLEKDKKYYEGFAAAADEVAQGSKAGIAAQIKSGVKKINDLENNKSNFFATSNFAAVIDQPLSDLQKQANQADEQQNELDKDLNQIRSKYSISSNSPDVR